MTFFLPSTIWPDSFSLKHFPYSSLGLWMIRIWQLGSLCAGWLIHRSTMCSMCRLYLKKKNTIATTNKKNLEIGISIIFYQHRGSYLALFELEFVLLKEVISKVGGLKTVEEPRICYTAMSKISKHWSPWKSLWDLLLYTYTVTSCCKETV